MDSKFSPFTTIIEDGLTLFVGDLHAKPSNREDTALLLDLIEKVAAKKKVKRIVFLGDVFHTHDVVHQEVARFMRDRIVMMKSELWVGAGSSQLQIYILAGNHDGSSPNSVETNAIRLVFDGIEGVYIVDDESKGMTSGPFFMVPFMGDNEKFIQTCQQHPDKILVCHQTVEGAYYENRSLAPGGVSQDRLPQRRIIAGHIHLEQRVGRTYYPGTPRALTSIEYNESKGIFVYDHRKDEWEKFSTNDIVKCFIRYDIEQGKEEPEIKETWKPKDDVRICIHGSEEFYKQMLEKHSGLIAKGVRFIPDIRKSLGKKIDVEAEGGSVQKSLHQYVHKIYDADDQTKAKVWNKLQKLIPNLGNVNS